MHSIRAYSEIPGMLGQCGDRQVFLGFAPARLLCAASFADTLDEDTGLGYQRPRDRGHSLDFKRYICQPKASTIPLTFNLRNELKRNWRLVRRPGGQMALKVRAGALSFAQVDCQHRLGELSDSDVSLAFMAFIGLDLRSEMALFTIINSKARGLSSSLTDFHTSNLMDDLSADAPHLLLARRLNDDTQSPWFKLIRCGGLSTSGMRRRTSLRMMQNAIRRFLVQTGCLSRMDIEETAQLLIAYWRAVATVFHVEWSHHRTHLITKGVGLYGLTQLLGTIVLKCGTHDRSEGYFVRCLAPLRGQVDWGTTGTFSSVGGHKGAAQVHSVLRGLVGV